jgi:hypothetical protein
MIQLGGIMSRSVCGRLENGALFTSLSFQHLLDSWVAAFCVNAFFGVVVGILAWRRVTSEIWPCVKPDPESSITRLGPLGS